MTFAEEEKILILDFGSQYTQLIARRIRELKVYCEIIPFNTPVEEIKNANPNGIILSGGPSSVYADDAPRPDKSIFELDIPILGICYGLQVIGYYFGGSVGAADRREYGHARFFVDDPKEDASSLAQGDYDKAQENHGLVEEGLLEKAKVVDNLNQI